MDFAHSHPRSQPHSFSSPPHSFGSPPRPYSATSRQSDRHSPTTVHSLSSYSFPPVAPPRTSDGVQRIVSSPILASFAVDPTESHFSYQPPPVTSPHSLEPFPEAHRPRSYSEFGLDSFANDYSNLERPLTPEPLEFSTLGRTVFEGGDARQTIASFSFAQFLPPIPSPEHLPPIPDLPPSHGPRYYYSKDEHRATYPAFPQYQRIESPAFEPPPPHPQPRAGGTAALEWAKPRGSPSSSRTHSQPQPPSQREAYSFPPVDTSPRSMQRTVSNQTASTSTTVGSSETYYENGQYSDEGFTGQGMSEEGGDAGMIEEFDDFDLQEPIEEEEKEETPKRRASIQQVDPPLTEDHTPPRPRSKSTKSQRPLKRSSTEQRPKAVPGLFRPSPESMLASSAVAGGGGGEVDRIVPLPHSSNRGRRAGQAWNAPALPDSIDFSSLPTKKSRGRRPPTAPELQIDEQANESGDTEYAGLTKTGKPKKIWLCKVSDCGRVFKRGEHLQRHVRSIHTDDKRTHSLSRFSSDSSGDWPRARDCFSIPMSMGRMWEVLLPSRQSQSTLESSPRVGIDGSRV